MSQVFSQTCYSCKLKSSVGRREEWVGAMATQYVYVKRYQQNNNIHRAPPGSGPKRSHFWLVFFFNGCGAGLPADVM